MDNWITRVRNLKHSTLDMREDGFDISLGDYRMPPNEYCDCESESDDYPFGEKAVKARGRRLIATIGTRSRGWKDSVSKYGIPMRILEYRRYDDISVRFYDGAVQMHTTMKNYTRGAVSHPTVHISVAHGKTVVKRGSKFAGFTLDFLAFEDYLKHEAYFACECDKCAYNNILSFREMVEHRDRCFLNSALA